MSSNIRPTKADLRALFEQYWLHSRHIENERAWFMSAYAAITGGVLTFVFLNDVVKWQPIVFLVILTGIGYLINKRWIDVFEHYRCLIKETGKELGVEAKVDIQSYKFLRIRFLFLLFYAIMFLGLIALLVYTFAVGQP